MPIQITISGDTAVEALRELHGLSAGLTPAAPPAPVAEPVPAGEERAFPEATKTTRKPRAAKAEVVADAPPQAGEVTNDVLGQGASAPAEEKPGEVTNDVPADDQVFTVDDARKALKDLLEQPDGKTKAQAVFAEMGAKMLSQIPEGSYKAFIAAIAKARGL